MNKHNVEAAAIRHAFNPDAALINRANEIVHDKLDAYLDAVVCSLQAELKEMKR